MVVCNGVLYCVVLYELMNHVLVDCIVVVEWCEHWINVVLWCWNSCVNATCGDVVL